MVSALLMGTIQESIFGPLLLPLLNKPHFQPGSQKQYVPAQMIKSPHRCCNLFRALLEMTTSVTQAIQAMGLTTHSIQMTLSGMVRAVGHIVPAAPSTLLHGSLKLFPSQLVTILSWEFAQMRVMKIHPLRKLNSMCSSKQYNCYFDSGCFKWLNHALVATIAMSFSGTSTYIW